MSGRRLASDEDLATLLRKVRTIAVVGLSPHPDRDSHRVSAYLQRAGYRILPIHPAGLTILGEPSYPSLAAIPSDLPVDLVDVFRRPDALPAVVEDAIRLGPPALWFQFGVTHREAEEAALAAGMDLIVDRCIMVEHRRLVAG
jgi:predicted CoA-binding protein